MFKKTKSKITKTKTKFATLTKDAVKAGNSTSKAISDISEKLKEIPHMPWKQLPVIGWVYIAIMIAIVFVCAILIYPNV